MELIENPGDFSKRFARWNGDEKLTGYTFVKNIHAPFTPVRRALPMLNLALISSAGAYIDGTEPFDLASRFGQELHAGEGTATSARACAADRQALRAGAPLPSSSGAPRDP